MLEFFVAATLLTSAALAGTAMALAAGRKQRAADLDLVIRAAAAWAQARGETEVTPEHVVAAILVDPDAAVRYAGSLAGAEWLRAAITERLDDVRPSGPPPVDSPQPTLSARLATAMAHARRRGRGEVTVLGLGRELAYNGAIGLTQLFDDARSQTDPPDVAPSGIGARAVYRSHARPPLVPVVFWDDPKTTMALVIELLEQVFGLSAIAAFYFMFAVHKRGHAVIGRYEPLDAQRMVASANERVKTAGAPLRVTIGEPRLERRRVRAVPTQRNAE